jgi:hypothetical protein
MTEERPRDRLGRPLPVGAETDAPPVPSIDGLSDAEVWRLAASLMDEGLPFHAHEVCESRWRESAAHERDLWRALAQWGAARTHEARGNSVGAQRVAARALATLDGADSVPAGVDVAAVRADCRRLAG